MPGICERCKYFTADCLCAAGVSQLATADACCDTFSAASQLSSADEEILECSVTLNDIIQVLKNIEAVSKDDIEVCMDEDSFAEASNSDRAGLLIFLEDQFVKNIYKDMDSDYFQNFLQTLQPFMYISSFLSKDKNSSCNIFQMQYVFEYPFGTQSIRIKVCIKEDSIGTVSLQRGISDLEALKNRYKTAILSLGGAENILMFSGVTIRLLFDNIYLPLTAERFDISSRCYYSNIDSFFLYYRNELGYVLNSILEDFAAQLVSNTKSPVSVYSDVSVAEHVYNHKMLTETGRMNVLAAIKSLSGESDSFKLTEAIKTLFTETSDAADIMRWLNNFSSPCYESEINKLLSEKED